MNLKLLSAFAATILISAPAMAVPVTLDFEGVTSFSSINSFYSGGTDSAGASGTNYGISFGGDALALSNDALGPYYSNAPSPGAVMTAVGSDAALNVAVGFINRVSFYYSSSAASSVGIWSGLNGTGALLGTINLAANAQQGNCSDSPYCYWALATLDFNGLARSIQFGSSANTAGFDNVSLTVPEPAGPWLLLAGLAGLGAMVRRNRAA